VALEVNAMKHRNLRIAWSVAWGVVAVLLVVLWVRSRGRLEVIDIPISTRFGIGFLLHDCSIAVQFGESRKNRLLINELQYVNLAGATSSDYRFPSPPLPPPPNQGAGFRLATAYARAPCWFVIVTAIVIAAIPWLRWHFRLRTLLIVTMLVAVVLGVVVWAIR
jgi:hypothetical protein